jgi:hypothetical protein
MKKKILLNFADMIFLTKTEGAEKEDLLNPCRFLPRKLCTAKTKCRKFETNIPRKRNIGASVPISTFMCP